MILIEDSFACTGKAKVGTGDGGEWVGTGLLRNDYLKLKNKWEA